MGLATIRIAATAAQVGTGAASEHCIWCPAIARYPHDPPSLGIWLSPLAAHSANELLLQSLVDAGVFATDPLRTDTSLIRQLQAADVRGVINFPSVSFIDGQASATLDQLGLGIEREIKFLVSCREAGLRIAGVASTEATARRL